MRVLFLDVDGVLAPWDIGELDPTCVRRLDTLVRRTGAALVLTSSWREHTPLDAIEAELHAAGLTAPLHDATPILLEGRAAEIRAWLAAHPETTRYLVLDDEPLAPHAPRQVRTNEYDGLTEADLEAALRLLGAAPPGE